MSAARPGDRQWLRCRTCEHTFTLALTLPCPLDVWCTAVRGARCPVCGGGPNTLDAYEPGREPPPLPAAAHPRANDPPCGTAPRCPLCGAQDACPSTVCEHPSAPPLARRVRRSVGLLIGVALVASAGFGVAQVRPRAEPFKVLVRQDEPAVTLFVHAPSGTCFVAFHPGGLVTVARKLCEDAGPILPPIGPPISPEQ